jgi:polyhydroxybutyrate depolymerase
MPGNIPDARFAFVASYFVNFFLGPQNHDIDGAETIWEFFKKFP